MSNSQKIVDGQPLSEMTWFTASLFYQGHSGIDEGLWEERIIILCGSSIDEVTRKAESIGKDAEVSYLNAMGEPFEWRFVKVSRVYQVVSPELGDGVEVFSRFLRQSEVVSLDAPFEDDEEVFKVRLE